MMKPELISKYEHQLTLKNYSENTLKAYLNGLNIFLQYLSLNKIAEVSSKELDLFFHHCKKGAGLQVLHDEAIAGFRQVFI